MKLKGPGILSQEEKPKKVFKQKFNEKNVSMKMGDSQFYTGCKVLPFPPNIISSTCLITFFANNFN